MTSFTFDTELPVQEFFRPLPICALLVMACNDHYFRRHWHNFITGKLSDFAVVLFFPALLTSSFALLILFWNRLFGTEINPSLTERKIFLSAFITAFALSSINISPLFRDYYLLLLNFIDVFDFVREYRYIVDPTDLIALIMLPLAVLDAFVVLRNIPARRMTWCLRRKIPARQAFCDIRRRLRDKKSFVALENLEIRIEFYIQEPSRVNLDIILSTLQTYRCAMRG